jgi:hypothetical protein
LDFTRYPHDSKQTQLSSPARNAAGLPGISVREAFPASSGWIVFFWLARRRCIVLKSFRSAFRATYFYARHAPKGKNGTRVRQTKMSYRPSLILR